MVTGCGHADIITSTSATTAQRLTGHRGHPCRHGRLPPQRPLFEPITVDTVDAFERLAPTCSFPPTAPPGGRRPGHGPALPQRLDPEQRWHHLPPRCRTCRLRLTASGGGRVRRAIRVVRIRGWTRPPVGVEFGGIDRVEKCSESVDVFVDLVRLSRNGQEGPGFVEHGFAHEQRSMDTQRQGDRVGRAAVERPPTARRL